MTVRERADDLLGLSPSLSALGRRLRALPNLRYDLEQLMITSPSCLRVPSLVILQHIKTPVSLLIPQHQVTSYSRGLWAPRSPGSEPAVPGIPVVLMPVGLTLNPKPNHP